MHHFVSRVGHTYGRRSLHGLLHIHVSQQRLGMSVFRTYPLALSQRRYTVLRAVNPVPYRARFFGEKIHLDQNEKLAVYGIVHVAAEGRRKTTQPNKEGYLECPRIPYAISMHCTGSHTCRRKGNIQAHVHD